MFGLPPDAQNAGFRQKTRRWLRSWPGVVLVVLLIIGGPVTTWLLLDPPSRSGAGEPVLDMWLYQSVFHFVNDGVTVNEAELTVTALEPREEYHADLGTLRYGDPQEISSDAFIAEDGSPLRPGEHATLILSLRGRLVPDNTYQTSIVILPESAERPAIALTYANNELAVRNNTTTTWYPGEFSIRYADDTEEYSERLPPLTAGLTIGESPPGFHNSEGAIFPRYPNKQAIVTLTAADRLGNEATFSLTIDNLLE